MFSFFLLMTKISSLFQKSSRDFSGQFSANISSSKAFLVTFGKTRDAQSRTMGLT